MSNHDFNLTVLHEFSKLEIVHVLGNVTHILSSNLASHYIDTITVLKCGKDSTNTYLGLNCNYLMIV